MIGINNIITNVLLYAHTVVYTIGLKHNRSAAWLLAVHVNNHYGPALMYLCYLVTIVY